ncbi:MAG: sulfite exporter TauE/SafE family protein [Betaproteobacteria bacterium]|nr:sulfite exporter TauE/SafE family protein [Betaproteobacteria bacterium]NBT74779.1 sulfite exporter TauE/SafE family protein [Betaproteobacteria bacterium]
MSLTDLTLLLELLALGAATGFLAGLLGIGGGMTMVPFLTMLFTARGFPPDTIVKTAIATSLSTILFTSISSARAHFKRGAVRIDLLRLMGVGACIGTFIGAHFAGALKDSALAAFFALFVGYSALQMLRGKKPKPGRDTPGPIVLGIVGGGIGLISSLLGAGGGFITVPFLTWCNVTMHQAVATSAGLGFPIALGGLVGYIIAGAHLEHLPPGSLGFIYLPALVILSVASVLMAPVGARTAHAMKVDSLRRVFAVLLLGLAAYMLTRAF